MTKQMNNRILVVDDNAAIHDDFRKILLGHRRNAQIDQMEAIIFDAPAPAPAPVFELHSAFQGEEALEKVTAAKAGGVPFAVAFVDVRMPPGWDGIETIWNLWKADPALQVVVCTAHSDYSWEKMTSVLGVNENLVILKKPFDNIEVLQLAHALTRKWHVTQQARLRLDELDALVRARTAELQRSNDELSRSKERFAKAFHANPIPSAIQLSGDERFVDVNEAFVEMTGFSREELIGRTPLELRVCIDYESRIRRLLREGAPIRNVECEISTRQNQLRSALISVEPITIGGEAHLLMMVQDISERLELEVQLRQAQKMESVGQLAAGIAHDFNNLLTVIQGHSSLQLATDNLTDDAADSMKQISIAADRAADLTRQLLAFSRRQVMRPRVVQLNEFVGDIVSVLQSAAGERVTLRWDLAENVPPIWADEASLEQVLLHLTMNARDAMPNGGVILITTQLSDVSAATAALTAEARPGRFVRLSVTDTGAGMDMTTRARIFEPFFTTKEVNQGSGMGLATVYGITKQHDGWIEVITALGGGSTFAIYFPVTDRTPDLPPALPTASTPAAQDHTILIVEDDGAVRELVKEILESQAYRVYEAENADDALVVWEQHAPEIELLLTDMVMPGSANGLELSQMLLAKKPELKVIYTSGYSSDLFGSDVKLRESVNYLPKPYLSSKLTAILANAFDPNGTRV